MLRFLRGLFKLIIPDPSRINNTPEPDTIKAGIDQPRTVAAEGSDTSVPMKTIKPKKKRKTPPKILSKRPRMKIGKIQAIQVVKTTKTP